MTEHDIGPSTKTSKQDKFEFNVFISFRGEDTRKGFTSHLLKELKNRGISTFIDREDLKKGQRISEVLKCIEEKSKIFVPVFSKNYADSKWCLMEITKMMKINKMAGQDRPIIPIFYHVDPFDVRNCKASFKAGFEKHERDEKLDEKTINKWKVALTKAGNLLGYCLSQTEEDEATLITLIGKEVSRILSEVPFDIQPIGIDCRINTLKQMLGRKEDGVCMIGICGQGGVGKTTISMALYNELSPQYEGRCFLPDVRESVKKDGLPSLQAKLMGKALLGESMCVDNFKQGISLMKQRIGSKKILLILDDVDHIDQLEAFTANRQKQEEWFSVGSKIIVTTRDKELLLRHGLKEEEIYVAEELDPEHSLQLFSHHAFVSDRPLAQFHELSKEAVKVTGGLPLALVVFGSLFYDIRDKLEWKEMLEILKREQHKDVHERLRISYEALNQREKCVFLDIACLLIGLDKEDPVYMWEACGYSPHITLKVLQYKSLVKITENGRFKMHDQIRDMGRMIVREEGKFDPKKYSRLWDKDDISQALKTAEVPFRNDHLQGFYLNEGHFEQRMSWKAIAAMHKLRMITDAYSSDFEEGEIWLPGNTRWLSWSFCPMETLSFHNSQHEQLVVLHLRCGHFREFGLRNMAFSKLKVLNLWGCGHLIHADFTHHPCLKKLVLDYCYSLAEIDESIGHLKKLIFLSMRFCDKLKGLPTRLCELTSLEFLLIYGCRGIEVLPERMGDLKFLKRFDGGRTSIAEIPNSIGGLESLEELNLKNCEKIFFVPKQIGNLKSLKDLDIEETPIREISDSIGGLESLQKLSFKNCKEIFFLPQQIRDLKFLKHLDLEGTSITEISDFIGELKFLQNLNLKNCKEISFLPKEIGDLKFLKLLDIGGTSITEISDSIGGLESLEVLDFNGCSMLRKMSDLVGGLKNLSELILCDCSALEQLPDSVGMLTSLRKLDLSYCESLREVPDSVEGLQNLLELSLDGCISLEKIPNSIRAWMSLERVNLNYFKSLKRLPDFVGDIKSMRKMSLRGCEALEVIPDFIGRLESLEDIDLCGCTSLKKISESIGNLRNLRSLYLKHCHSLQELPESIGSLQSLEVLDYSGGTSLAKVPEFIGKLKKLRELLLTDIEEISDPIAGLPQLQLLCVESSPRLKSLPELPCSLYDLTILGCGALKLIPNVSNLKDLRRLRLGKCEGLKELPGLESLRSLKTLELIHCEGLGRDLMNRLSQASFERLRVFSISGVIVGPDLLFGFPKGQFHGLAKLKGYFCLTEEPLVDSTINVCIQVLADGRIISEDTLRADNIVDRYFENLKRDFGLESNVLRRIGFEMNNEIRKYVAKAQVMVRVPTTYQGYQLKMGYFLFDW